MTTFESQDFARGCETQETPQSRKPKVMVVEDETMMALDIRSELIRLGFSVGSMAQSGAEALREIERQMPDIVLMDINLKGEMDGIQTADLVRSRHALPVVYMTSYIDDATVNRALATEPFGYLVKPFVNASLRATLLIALNKH